MKTTKRYGKKADLALSMWVKLARAAGTFGRLTGADIEGYGLTAPQFSVLEALGHLGPMTIGDLGRKTLSTGGNMTVVVGNLEREGLVSRTHDPKDRRVIMVELTAKGTRLFSEIFPKHAAFVGKIASVLTEEEQAELSRLLKKLGTTCRKNLSGN